MFVIGRSLWSMSRRRLGCGLWSCRSLSAAANQCGAPVVANRILAAVDFDKTIVERDSYLTISELLPAEKRGKKLEDLVARHGWTSFIETVLKQLFCEHKVDSTAVGRCVRLMEPVPGMVRLLRRLARVPALDLCIISDSNSYFIGEWLRDRGIEDLFHAVYTNPGCVQASGELLVLPFEDQSQCDLCPANLCKGAVLQQLMDTGRYQRVVYVGDSCNDLCAMQRLRADDVACIRRGYELHGKMTAHGKDLCCKVISWRTGYELEDNLLSKMLA
ncbi:pyridoxal phosphate phosphatase PHOSPHO2 [Drosophila bipectinata]|uniref:pyridoxal phosphate phosphatase PHOSPHO2 n=1 Tax=Drosophila bipectinata TaxID=42026 RepID=UPI001C893F30|nr:pyridoxal phosphate phosphatase PHOSPHO2 [Drosophila bipectinata]